MELGYESWALFIQDPVSYVGFGYWLGEGKWGLLKWSWLPGVTMYICK